MKKFYKSVSVEAADTGHIITLDGRLVKTPGKAMLVMPTRALADAVAQEWESQGEKIDPDTMHQTRLANTAIDRVAPRHDDVATEVAAFGGSDLLCYRVSEPVELVDAHARVWNPYLDWAKQAYGIALKTTVGIMPVRQAPEVLEVFLRHVRGHDAFELTGLHAFTSGFGSLILAMAYMEGFSPLEAVWQASILDAIHQEEAWGVDEEAQEKRARLRDEMMVTATFISHLRNK